MRPMVTDGVALSVSLSVGHIHEPCKNGWIDRDAVWQAESRWPKEPCIKCGRDFSTRRGNLGEVFWPIEKHWEPLTAAVNAAKGSFSVLLCSFPRRNKRYSITARHSLVFVGAEVFCAETVMNPVQLYPKDNVNILPPADEIKFLLTLRSPSSSSSSSFSSFFICLKEPKTFKQAWAPRQNMHLHASL